MEVIIFISIDDNVKLHVSEKCSDPPFIYIHGGPGSWSKDFELFCKIHLEKSLKMKYIN